MTLGYVHDQTGPGKASLPFILCTAQKDLKFRALLNYRNPWLFPQR